MRVLGIEVSGSDSSLVILDGTAKACTIRLLSPSKLRFPAAGDEIDRLIALKKQIHEILQLESVERVGVIRADQNSSPIRAKVECLIQLASKEASVPCDLVAAQTVAAADKRKVGLVAGPEIEQKLRQVNPAYLRKAAHCAWSVLNAREQ